jgi:hypothetical protein
VVEGQPGRDGKWCRSSPLSLRSLLRKLAFAELVLLPTSDRIANIPLITGGLVLMWASLLGLVEW